MILCCDGHWSWSWSQADGQWTQILVFVVLSHQFSRLYQEDFNPPENHKTQWEPANAEYDQAQMARQHDSMGVVCGEVCICDAHCKCTQCQWRCIFSGFHLFIRKTMLGFMFLGFITLQFLIKIICLCFYKFVCPSIRPKNNSRNFNQLAFGQP